MERSWVYRRLNVFITNGFCMGIILAIVALGDDTMLFREIVSGAFMLLGATNGFYIAGAAWDDRNKAREILDGISPFKDGPQS